jgi:hypothetical protein
LKYFLKDEKNHYFELPEQLEDIISSIDDDELTNYARREFAPLELTACVDLILPAVELFTVLCGCCTIAQMTSNNWRRMHGIPMRRRRRA